jgi:hypothetical protein
MSYKYKEVTHVILWFGMCTLQPRIKVMIHETESLRITVSISLILSSKVKHSHYRPEQALRFPGSWGSQFSRQSAHEGGKVVSLFALATFTPQEIILVHISVRGWVDPRAIVWLERLFQWKIPMTPSQLVAQRLNQLHHHTAPILLSTTWKM